MVPLNKNLIKPHTHLDAPLEIFDSINSTNDHLKQFVKEGLTRICLSEQQTEGRGREQRAWHSPSGVNIYFSCLYYFDKPLSELPGLSLVVGLAIAKTLQQMTQKPFLVKWPNDVYFETKKISGNLIELYRYNETRTAAIIGIGINVNMQSDDNFIDKPWTSLQKILDQEFERNGIVSQLIANLFAHLKQFVSSGLSEFLKEWKEYDFLKNKPLKLQTSSELVSGTSQGIDEQGRIQLKTPEGTLRSFSSGEIIL